MAAVRKDWKLSFNLGWCYFRLGRFLEARTHLTQAVELAPVSKSSECNWALGTAYLKGKDFRNAEAYLLESLRLKDSYTARISLALVYLHQGKVREAEDTHLGGIERKAESRRNKGYAAFLSDVAREKEAAEMNLKAESLRQREQSPKKSGRVTRPSSRGF